MAKFDSYQVITDTIIAALEAGPGAWKKNWASLGISGLPYNGNSNRHYNGLNIWLLAMAGYADPRWYTFKGSKEATGYVKKGRGYVWTGEGQDPKHGVRKGEKGTKIIFWKFIFKTETDTDGREVTRSIPILRIYTVFNATQISGIEPLEEPEVVEDPYEGAQACQQRLIDSDGMVLNFGGDRAYYSPGSDYVQLPHLHQFDTIEAYWSTAMHEFGHWTGHTSRLNRDFSGRFGTESYAMEELVAELTAAFTCASLGIEGGELQHPEYISNWLKVLGGDKYAVFTAASKARAAADLVIEGKKAEQSNGDDNNGDDVAMAAK